MSLTTIGVIGIIVLLILLFSNMPVGFVMAMIGFLGFAYLKGWGPGFSVLTKDFFQMFSAHSLTVIPLFMFMGQISFYSGISRRLYDSAYVLMGARKGGLAMATVAACAGFAAISGSTNATAATMATVTLPEMKRFGYDMGLATGAVAAAGSLGILIPPSTLFIVYGILTEQSIGKLFVAGILPGLLLAALFMLAIYLRVRHNPALAPAGPKTTFIQKVKSLTGVLEALLIFGAVMGGLFVGLFTPTEAAATGAFFTLLLSVIRRQLSWKDFLKAIADTTRLSCMVMVIVAGATVFGHFMAVTRIPFDLSIWVGGLPLPRMMIMMVIILIYLVGGCFMDGFALIMLTVPIFFPVALALGFDPIWFGVIIVLIAEMGVITPPVGINVYVVYGVAKTIPLQTIFKGVMPFLLALIICNVLLLIFPQIALFLPGLM
ncbi:TRAP transporter large permease [Desulfobacula sp.]|uniref:TRAP transporter large permease n=1 Tax=Desulfobacula sp. TaxID=2593537 RepID=UPI0026307D4D|nr:TRAP transporter large permease [Desulfobacula sp.]